MKDAAGILASAESNERLDATTQDFQSMTRECDEAEQQFQQYEKIKRLSRARDHLSLVRYDLEYFHETQSKMIEFETRLVESNYERMDEMYAEWKPFDQWRYRMIEQVRVGFSCAADVDVMTASGLLDMPKERKAGRSIGLKTSLDTNSRVWQSIVARIK